jgi:hypothetical protein
MKPIALFLLIVGLLVGPAYWVYAKFYTGSQLALLELKREDNGHWRSPTFTLTADMASVGLVMHAQAATPPPSEDGRVRQNRSVVLLHRDDETAKPLPFSLRVTDTGKTVQTFREHLVYMQQVKPGQYWLAVEPTPQSEISFTNMQLEVRRNLAEPDTRVVTVGMVMGVLGLLGLLII